MRKILEELYHGNLSVDERTIRAGSKYARAAGERVHDGGLHYRLPNGRADYDGGLAPRQPVAGADRKSISRRITRRYGRV